MPAALMLRRAADRLGAELGQAFLHGSRIQSRDIAAYFGINGAALLGGNVEIVADAEARIGRRGRSAVSAAIFPAMAVALKAVVAICNCLVSS